MNIQRCYEILEIDLHASPETVRQAYEDLLQAWNPEAFSKSPHLKEKAEKKLREIHEAYHKIVANQSTAKPSDAPGNHSPYSRAASGHPRPGAASEKGSTGSRRVHGKIHPWARFSARSVDYLLFSVVLLMTKFFQMAVWEHVPSFFFPVIITFLWVFVETMLLHLFGTTIGKWIFGIEIIDRFLKKPGLWNACVRSLSVWCNGVGTGFFLIAPATFTVSYVRLRRDGIAPWDRMGKFRTIHGKPEYRRILAVGLCAAAVLMLAIRLEERRGRQGGADIMHPRAENQDPVSPADRNRAIVETGGAQKGSSQPDAERTLLAQANSYLLMGRYEDAILAYRSIIVERPDLAEARYGLGVSYAKGRRYGAAIKELEEAVRLAPEYAEAHHILGLLYLTSGDRDAALKEHRVLAGLDKKLAEELFIYISNMQNFVEKNKPPPK